VEPATEKIASRKHVCPACGGEFIWNPGKQALVCPYCGTTSGVAAPDGTIQEHDLIAALRSIPDDKRGWAVDTMSVRCQHCLAISVFSENRLGQRCDFCGSSQLVPYEETKAPFRPESVMPIKIAESGARDLIKRWVAQVWFAPNNLLRLTRTDIVTGMYLPFWTFDAQVEADWSAEAGHYYYTTESFTDSAGKIRTRQVRHTRWQPASGHVSHFFDDQLVCASRGVHTRLVESVSPFPTQELIPYDPSYVKGWLVEHYQLDLAEAAQDARRRMVASIEAMCARAVPGDTHRSLRVSPDFSNQTFKHILAPVWLISYTYKGSAYQVVVNGVTGAIQGEYPKSWIKIACAVVTVLLLLALALYAIGPEGLESGVRMIDSPTYR